MFERSLWRIFQPWKLSHSPRYALFFKTKTCIQIEHSNIKIIFITYLMKFIL